jgi:hypothetical protein
LFVALRQRAQGVIQRHDIDRPRLRDIDADRQRHLMRGAALGGLMAARVVDQDLSHQARRDGDEVRAILRGGRPSVEEPEVGFVDQGFGFERVRATLAAQVAVRDGAQLVVDERHQRVQRGLVARAPLDEQFRHAFRGRRHGRSFPDPLDFAEDSLPLPPSQRTSPEF